MPVCSQLLQVPSSTLLARQTELAAVAVVDFHIALFTFGQFASAASLHRPSATVDAAAAAAGLATTVQQVAIMSVILTGTSVCSRNLRPPETLVQENSVREHPEEHRQVDEVEEDGHRQTETVLQPGEGEEGV